MVISHFTALVLYALLTSVVFGVVRYSTTRDRAIYGAKVFGAFVGTAIILGWIMYFLP